MNNVVRTTLEYLYWVFAHSSMLLNVLTGGLPYESLCARFMRLSQSDSHWSVVAYARGTVKFMHLLDPGHCQKAGRCRDIIHKSLRLGVNEDTRETDSVVNTLGDKRMGRDHG